MPAHSATKSNKSLTSKPKKGSGSQTVIDTLRMEILDLKIPPGADLEEPLLVARFGVSRTPIREAIIRLSSEGLVQIVPNRGARVAHLDTSDIPSLLEMLEISDRLISRFAALRRTDSDLLAIDQARLAFETAVAAHDYSRMAVLNNEFHFAIAKASGNRFLEEQYRSVGFSTVRLAKMAFFKADTDSNVVDLKATNADHMRIYNAIRDRDADAADNLAKIHAQGFLERIVRFLSTNAAGSVPLSEPKAAG